MKVQARQSVGLLTIKTTQYRPQMTTRLIFWARLVNNFFTKVFWRREIPGVQKEMGPPAKVGPSCHAAWSAAVATALAQNL
jgi:hypothetical protein